MDLVAFSMNGGSIGYRPPQSLMRISLSVLLVCTIGCTSKHPEGAGQPSLLSWLDSASVNLERRNLVGAKVHLDSAITYLSGTANSELIPRTRLLDAEVRLLSGDFAGAIETIDNPRHHVLEVAAPSQVVPREWVIRGRAHLRLGSYSEALADLLTSIDALQESDSNLGADLGEAQHYVGLVFHEQGQLEEALLWYERALSTRISVHGRLHRNVAATLNNIGNIHWRRGAFDQALATHSTALDIKTAILGHSDMDVAVSHSNLAYLYSEMGEPQRADYHYETANRLYEASPSNVVFYAESLNDFGNHKWLSGREAEAAEMWRTAIEIYAKALGPEHS